MNEKDIADLYAAFKAKPTEELINIWLQNDRQTFRAELFEAIRQVLIERGITPPFQDVSASRVPVGPQLVIVTDITLGFWSMVGFMVKWVIAAIPACIILWLLGMVLWVIFGSIIVGVL